MGFLDNFPSQDVVIVHEEDSGSETRTESRGNIQDRKGYFDVSTPVYEGDVVELPDPRGGLRRLLVTSVAINDQGPSLTDVNHIEVTWGKAPPPRVAAIRGLGLEGLHPLVLKASGNLFADGHYSSAILEAFKALEVRVRAMSGLDTSGQDLMARAFDENNPIIRLAIESGQSGQDEQRGLKFVYMGVMVGIRNPKAHEVVNQQDPQRSVEYLAMASILMRRLDDADAASERV